MDVAFGIFLLGASFPRVVDDPLLQGEVEHAVSVHQRVRDLGRGLSLVANFVDGNYECEDAGN